MRILYYNWVDYLDDEKRGGGVSVYQKNLIRALDDVPGVQTVFLSSGISYDLFSSRPRWERVRHGMSRDRKNRYEIVNSGVLSPAHHAFGNRAQIEQPETTAAFFDFVEKTGPYDVVHFNNLEGLPAEVLTLKTRFPDTKVIFSLHNYYPVCPQVNLWHQERENCRDFDKGRKCEHCLPHRHDERIVRLADAVAFNLKKAGVRPGTRLFDRAFVPGMRLARRAVGAYARLSRKGRAALALPAAPPPKVAAGLLTPMGLPHRALQRRREEFVALINAHCDLVLGVSRRVCDVAAHFGIDPKLLRTSYIGTAQAPKFAETAPKPSIVRPDGTLTLAYLGYMRRDKGFFFLLDALESLPDKIAARLRLVICARRGDDHTMGRILALSERFDDVFYADGYAHDDLDKLLSTVDLGVVPVLWEDNLPQVAIEMHARHIPLLTSDLGGARELSGCADMVFRSGSTRDLAARLAAVMAGEVMSEDYWARAMAPVSMETHVAQLLGFYGADPAILPETLAALLPAALPGAHDPEPLGDAEARTGHAALHPGVVPTTPQRRRSPARRAARRAGA